MNEEVTVTGGVGGTRARLGDLELCAAALVGVADDLGALRRTLSRLGEVVDDAARVSPATARPARWAVARLSSARHGVPAAADRARDSADRLRRAARAYADADDAAATLLRRWAVTTAHTLGEAGPLGWLGFAVAAVPAAVLGGGLALRLVGLRMVARSPTAPGIVLGLLVRTSERRGGQLGRWLGGPGLLPELGRPTSATLDTFADVVGAFVVGAAPGRNPVPGGLVPWSGGDRRAVQPTPVREAARLLTVPSHLASRALHGPTALVVTPQPVVRRGRAPSPPRSAADLVAGIADVHPSASAPPGTVAVHRLEDTGGTSWVVTIPGTQSGSLTGGPLPADMTSNLDLAAGHQDDVSTLVREAMEQAGIAPDEPVQLVGHSQGGIAAVATANHPDVRARYDVRTVITAGSPVGSMTLPADVLGAHFEHREDGVVASDGVPPPDRPNQTFVQVTLARSADPEQRAAALTWSGAHAVGGYAASAAIESQDASLTHARRTIEGLLGGPGTTMTTRWFSGARLPVDRPLEVAGR